IVLLSRPALWFHTDKVIEPRLRAWNGEVDEVARADRPRPALEARERQVLWRAGVGLVGIAAPYVALPTTPACQPLINLEAEGTARLQPLYAALLAGFFLLFVSAGIAYGSAAGTVKSYKDVTDMMQDGIRTIAPYIVFVFFAAH